MRQRTKLKKKFVNHSERPDLELTYTIFFLAYPVGQKKVIFELFVNYDVC